MGGSINVAIRFPDGRAICQTRWTNNMPFWFKHPKMYSGDPEHLAGYLAMTRNNDYVLDPYATGRPARLVNNAYGLIVFDYVANVLLDNNGYSNPINFHIISAVDTGRRTTITINSEGVTDSRDSVPFKLEENFEACARAGILHRVTWNDDRTKTVEGPLSFEEVEARIREDYPRWRELYHVTYAADPAPLVYTKFEETNAGTKAMRERLREIGFPRTKKEGLNADVPKIILAKGPVDELELKARKIFQRLKSSNDEWKATYDGVAWEKLPPNAQKTVLDFSAGMSKDDFRDLELMDIFG